MKNIVKNIFDGLLAGIMISIGGTVYLSCVDSNKYIGALFFSVALLCICFKEYSLFTGKIGYVIKNHSKDDISIMLLGLLGNAAATIGLGYIIAYALPSVKESALIICNQKLESNLLQIFIKAALCGILVYLAVDIYKVNKSTLGIIFCIPTFILCGFEHSIADIFYFAASGIASWNSLLFIFIVIVGNSIGALVIPLLKLVDRNNHSLTNVEIQRTRDSETQKKD